MHSIELSRLDELEQVIERGMKTFVEVGAALLEIRESDDYKKKYGYSTFEEYCRERWGWARNYANKLIASAEVVENLGTIVPILPTKESQVRPLTRLEPEVQREVWAQVIDTTPREKITAAVVQQAVNEYQNKPHVSFNSGNNEWYTPIEFIDAAYKVMGAIDLDPASSAIANRTVGALDYFTAEDDGLAHEWRGRVWLNPPYAGELIGKFCNKLAAHWARNEVTEAIVLVNNSTETAWFESMTECASAIVFPKTRVRFLDPEGKPGAPLQGQAIFYMGPNADKFRAEFYKFGWGATLWQPY